MDTITERMRDIWNGPVDYNPIATREVLVSELLVGAVDVHHGERVLDVAAGTGNTALAAARRNARVMATDFGAPGLETARRRAEVEGLEIHTQVADTQDLPFEDDSFDVVLSSFGAMYAPDQQRAADELVRVCRPGGRIGLASWTPDGLVGRIQQANVRHLPAPPPGPPPTLWGSEQHCRILFGSRVAMVTSTVRTVDLVAASAKAQVDFMRQHLPPWRALYEQLDPSTAQQVAAAVATELDRANRATDGTLVVPAEYLELVATVA